MASWPVVPPSASMAAADAASAVADAATATAAAISSIDPTGLYSSNIVSSALFTIGDAQFFEESISPATVRNQLSITGDPSNPSTTLNLLKGMKWLLANMSKGRNVSDFFPHVVKLVGVPSLEVRKMVYIYLARYANHDSSCRELALLSINAFQRGLADREPLLRSLALRVLTCMDVPDVLQLQILGVRTCCKDSSPYVRKCAANAVCKLHPRCLVSGDDVQAEQLVEIITRILDEDGSTMVLTSAIIAFCEICPHRLELLHRCYRKVCHLLTDMDEWGQVVVMDVFMQYCRKFFKQPRGQMDGSAELIDRERRVTRSTRTMMMMCGAVNSLGQDVGRDGALNGGGGGNNNTPFPTETLTLDTAATSNGSLLVPPARSPRQKVKRRVVRKAFYSDEEDESSEEEVDPFYPITGGNVARTLREPELLGTPTKTTSDTFFRDDIHATSLNGNDSVVPTALALNDDEDNDLDEDHKLLLQSSMPLLKSRNSAVVLAACSLQYHCGVASIKTRSALGKALVRIHRDRREIQYVVLLSIRTLVHECPSAFSPFLNDFFVKGMDPPFTRMIKLDILLTLSTDPKAVETVLTELRTYVRHSDKVFACAAIRAVAKVAELARIAYDRRAHTVKEVDMKSARADSNAIALNCLSGLVMLSEYSKNGEVVGECAMSIQRILSQLWSDDGTTNTVKDSTRVQERALKRLLLIIVRSLTNPDDDNGDEEKTAEQTKLELKAVRVPDAAIASSIFIIGEWLTMSRYIPSSWSIEEKSKKKIRLEVMRLLARTFTSLDQRIKLQAVHLASKVLLSIKDNEAASTDISPKERVLSEFVLAMANMDVLQDVRDRARYESNLLHMTVGLNYDASTLQQPPAGVASTSVDTVKSMLLGRKPITSSVPLDRDEFACAQKEVELFRFGTLSNVLCNTPTGSTLPLPKWAEKDSPGALRDTSTAKNSDHGAVGTYVDSSDDESSSSSSSSEDSSSSSSSEDSSDESSESTSSSRSSSSEKFMMNARAVPNGGSGTLGATSAQYATPSMVNNIVKDDKSSSDSSSCDSDDSDSDDSDSDDSDDRSKNVSEQSLSNKKVVANATSKPSFGTILDLDILPNSQRTINLDKQQSSGSGVAEGLEDLVMAPLVTKSDIRTSTNIDDESGAWKDFVRPELSGGLYVKMRFVHGNTRVRETEIMGLDPKSPSTVCLQVHIENIRSDAGSLRHVRIVHRGGSSSGMISPLKAITPPEIPVLSKGMTSTFFIGLTFATATDRDGVTVAKFDVKSDRGMTSIEVRPTLGELLCDDAPRDMNQSDFDKNIAGLHGIQRTSSSYTLSPMNTADFDSLSRTILQHLNLKLIGKWTERGCFVGVLPSSGQEVYVTVKWDNKTGIGDILVCCSDAIAANSIMNLMKLTLRG